MGFFFCFLFPGASIFHCNQLVFSIMVKAFTFVNVYLIKMELLSKDKSI